MNEIDSTECVVIGNIEAEKSLPLSSDITPKKIVGIYGLQNKLKPEKWYVGQSIDIYDRWTNYNQIKCKSQIKIYRALLKYGVENFKKIILEECAEDKDLLDSRETYWIIRHDSIKNGYNIKGGGSHGRHSDETKLKMSMSARNRPPMSEKTRKKISALLTGKKRSPEVRERMSQAAKNICPETRKNMAIAQIGKKHSAETRRKLSEISKNMSDETKLKMSLAAKGKKKTPFTLEHRANLSKARLGKKHTEETKAKISYIQKGNRPWAREIALNMAKNNIGRKQSPETIAKRMATIKTNKLKNIDNSFARVNCSERE